MTYTPDTYSDFKASVRYATVAVLSNSPTYSAGVLTAGSNGILAVDGVNTVLGDRILVKNQASDLQNGLYYVSTEGTAGVPYVLTRARDADQDYEITPGMMVTVEAGGTLADTVWTVTTDTAITIGSTAITFAQISGGGTADLNPAYRRSWFGVG
jgi:hypothetical protein